MKTIEQNNIEMVTAKIEELWNKGDIYQTDQFFAEQIAEAFEDQHYMLADTLAQGEKVIARIVITGTHNASFAGNPPTGKSVQITQFREFHIVDGKITNHSGWFDTGTLLPQIQAK
ncbi:MAG: ester cyclase [Paenibacillus lautus]|uniref:ester cyclase n=1 Tax=Paenibacillus lautus TaxID=1401 RepID=UPI0026F137C8|nr:ester cyclase [Paenibacillus lautus]MCI1772578.1 ester cyclase [Paenibacillus lautus]